MATVSLQGTTTLFERLHLRISAGAGPVIEVSLPVNHPWKRESALPVASFLGERAEIEWAGQTMSFRVTGFRSTPEDGDLMIGIVLSDETLDWLEMRRTDTAATVMLVYQRQEDDANGWSFLRRVLGGKFAAPHGKDDLDERLPVGTCFLRPAGCDNLVHQERILGLLRNSPTQPWGWCAIDAESSAEPLRLLGLDAPVVELDAEWAPADAAEVYLPHRALGPNAPAAKLKRTFSELEHSHAATVVREVTRKGLMTALPDLFKDSDQIVCLPCQVAVGGITALCPVISFSFDMRSHLTDQKVELTTVLQLRPLPTTPAASPARFTTEGTFVEWTDDSQKTRTLVMPPQDARWQMMGGANSKDVETVDSERGLVCEAVTPFASRQDWAGFYVSHKQNDVVLVDIVDGQEPRMVGMRQVYAEGLESVDLVLNSETVSISALAKDADLATADGVAVDGAAGTVKVFAAQHVELKQKVTVTDESTAMEHAASVKSTMSIGGDTTIGGKTEITGDTVIKATLEVGA